MLVAALIGGGSVLSFSQTDEVLAELADEMFEFGDHDGALGLYKQAIKENPNNVKAQFMAGRCHLISVDGKAKAYPYFLKAKELDPEISPKIHYYLAEGYRYAYDFDNAIKNFELYKKDLKRGPHDDQMGKELERVDVKIFHCQNAKEITATEVNVEIVNLGRQINSESNDYAPVLSANEEVLIFTSRRPGSTGKSKDVDNLPFEDLYISRKQGDKWGAPENIGESINTDQHDATIGLSANGESLFIYKGTGNGDIYESDYEDGEWTRPKPVKEVNDKNYKETSICVTHPGYIYFSSDRPGGKGRTDLYVIEKDEKGKYGDPKNLGSVINTKYDEESPYFDVNTNTLYFSSKGHKSIGGYDIFKSVYDEETGEWSEPENLGFPINTPDDDIFFTISGDSKRGYYSSHRKDGFGGNDLYVIYFNEEPEEIPEDTATEIAEIPEDTAQEIELQKVALYINVKAYDSQEALDAQVEIIDKTTGEQITKTTAFGGELSLEFNNEEPRNYEVFCQKDGYVYKSLTVLVPGMTGEEQKIYKTLALRKEEVGRINPLRNIYFDFDRHTLKSESYAELNKLLEMMQSNQNLRVEIAGHTDFVGPDGYNDVLSRQRAKAVVDYLKSKGISPSRVSYKGYGETKPLAANDDFPELNRRTEFIIIEK